MTQVTAPPRGLARPETSQYAIVAFVVALLGLFSPIPFLFPVLAWSFSSTARGHIRDNPGRVTGLELASAARFLAQLALGLWVLMAFLAAIATAIYLGGN